MFDRNGSTLARYASHLSFSLAFNPITGAFADRRQETAIQKALWPERRKIGLIVITVLLVASTAYTVWTVSTGEDRPGTALFVLDIADILIAGTALWFLVTNRRGPLLDVALFCPALTISSYVAAGYAAGIVPWDMIPGVLMSAMFAYGVFIPHRPPWALATLIVLFASYVGIDVSGGEHTRAISAVMVSAIWVACMLMVRGSAISRRQKVVQQWQLEELAGRLDQNIQDLELEKQAVERSAEENAALADQLALARMEAENKSTLLEVVLDNVHQGVIAWGTDMKVIECNTRFAEFMHLPEELTVPGTRAEVIFEHSLLEGVLGSQEDRDFAIENVRRHVQMKDFEPLILEREIAPNLFVELRLMPLPGGGLVTTIANITERKLAEASVRFKALHDALTGLANRELFRDRLEAAVARAGRTGHYAALAMVDLDKFKPVNDTYGHPIGDALLQEFGKILKRLVREVDTVARLGGDEFAIIFDGIATLRDVSLPLDRILQRLAEPVVIDGNEIHIGASMGMAFYPLDAANGEDLERRADGALLEAKRAGRGRYHYYRHNALVEPAKVSGFGL